MLAITRKCHEGLKLILAEDCPAGTTIGINVVFIDRNVVRLGIDALKRQVTVLRNELLEAEQQ